MTGPQRLFMRLASAAVLLPCLSVIAAAQTYPSRPVTIVVPCPAAGPAVVLARILAERMREALGQPVVIENVVGAAGTLASGRVVRATPDGHTIILGNLGTHVVNGAIYPLQYDLAKDFEPIAMLPSNHQLLIANKAAPAKDLRDLIARLKANPDKVTIGNAGPGSPSHLTAVYFQTAVGSRFQLVPYRGTPQVLQDLIAGQIDLVFDQASSSLPQVRSGQLKTYGVTAKMRLASAPEIPTLDESGLPGFYASIWFGLWAPKDTPAPTIARHNSAVVETLADPGVRMRLAGLGSDLPSREQQTPEALRAFQKAEIEKWWPLIKAAGIKAE
ncbi:MAG: tripartite tricarboxylate transporter substrate-binding protein [Xanthobacteraceae bacterium]